MQQYPTSEELRERFAREDAELDKLFRRGLLALAGLFVVNFVIGIVTDHRSRRKQGLKPR